MRLSDCTQCDRTQTGCGKFSLRTANRASWSVPEGASCGEIAPPRRFPFAEVSRQYPHTDQAHRRFSPYISGRFSTANADSSAPTSGSETGFPACQGRFWIGGMVREHIGRLMLCQLSYTRKRRQAQRALVRGGSSLPAGRHGWWGRSAKLRLAGLRRGAKRSFALRWSGGATLPRSASRRLRG